MMRVRFRSTTKDSMLKKEKVRPLKVTSVLLTREDVHVNPATLKALVKLLLKVRLPTPLRAVLLETEERESPSPLLRTLRMTKLLLVRTEKLPVDAETETVEVAEGEPKLKPETEKRSRLESLLEEVVPKDNLLVSVDLATRTVPHVSLVPKEIATTLVEMLLATKETKKVAREVLVSKVLLVEEEEVEAAEVVTAEPTTMVRTVSQENLESPESIENLVLKEIALPVRTVEEIVPEVEITLKVVLLESPDSRENLANPELLEVATRARDRPLTRKVDALVEEEVAEAPDPTVVVLERTTLLLRTTDYQ